MRSRRLPGKVLRPLAGRPVLQYLLERVGRCTGLYQVPSRCSDSRPLRPADTAARPYQSECAAGGRYGALETTLGAVAVATSSDSSDEPIARFCDAFGVRCIRGPLEDVALRFKLAAETLKLDAFVRLCADSPLLDPQLITRAVDAFRSGNVDLVTNVFPRTFPPGQSVEVMGVRVFAAALPSMNRPGDREHVTKYFYEHPDRYRFLNLSAEHDATGADFAVDTEADLERIAALVAALDRPHWEYGLAHLIAVDRELRSAARGVSSAP